MTEDNLGTLIKKKNRRIRHCFNSLPLTVNVIWFCFTHAPGLLSFQAYTCYRLVSPWLKNSDAFCTVSMDKASEGRLRSKFGHGISSWTWSSYHTSSICVWRCFVLCFKKQECCQELLFSRHGAFSSASSTLGMFSQLLSRELLHSAVLSATWREDCFSLQIADLVSINRLMTTADSAGSSCRFSLAFRTTRDTKEGAKAWQLLGVWSPFGSEELLLPPGVWSPASVGVFLIFWSLSPPPPTSSFVWMFLILPDIFLIMTTRSVAYFCWRSLSLSLFSFTCARIGGFPGLFSIRFPSIFC